MHSLSEEKIASKFQPLLFAVNGSFLNMPVLTVFPSAMGSGT
jgi:hypothetical protein